MRKKGYALGSGGAAEEAGCSVRCSSMRRPHQGARCQSLSHMAHGEQKFGLWGMCRLQAAHADCLQLGAEALLSVAPCKLAQCCLMASCRTACQSTSTNTRPLESRCMHVHPQAFQVSWPASVCPAPSRPALSRARLVSSFELTFLDGAGTAVSRLGVQRRVEAGSAGCAVRRAPAAGGRAQSACGNARALKRTR